MVIEPLCDIGQRFDLASCIEIDIAECASNLLLQFDLVVGHVLAKNAYLAAIDLNHVQDRFDRSRFSCAIGTDKPHNITFLQLKRYIF
ncbi:hypothetical protein D3C76_1391720 [compost metagenome]